MAVIGKIRKHSTLVLIVIGVALLAFVLTDAFTSSGRGEIPVVGKIGDTEITQQEFEQKVNEAINNYEMQQQQPVDDKTRSQIREQVWNQLISETVLQKEYEKLGIAVTPDELFDMVQGNNPHPQIVQAFTNPQTGQFDKTRVLQFLKNKDNDPQTAQQWILFEQGIKQERLANKYTQLINKAIYATTAEAAQLNIDQNKKFNISYVVKRYNTVNDSTITVTEEEIAAYYEENKFKFKQEESRNIEYVIFRVDPSEEDFKLAEEWMLNAKEEFAQAENDSLYVTLNSDIPFDPTFYKKGQLPPILDTVFFKDSAKVGDMVGPYLEGMTYKLSKLSKIKYLPDSVKARHILIKTQNPYDSVAVSKIDSLKKAVENGADFAELAKKFSEDLGSAQEGGDLGWFGRGRMVKTFEDACFNGKPGDLKIVPSQYGLHLIKIEEQSEKTKHVQVATLADIVDPSDETYDRVFTEASEFYNSIGDAEDFDKIIEEKGYTKRIGEIKPNDFTLAGLDMPREIIRWAYTHEENEVSSPLTAGDAFVIVKVASVNEEGVAPLEKVRTQVELLAKKQKKGEQFAKEMEGITDLNQLAQKLNTTVEKANNVTFASFAIPGLGREPKLLGAIAAMNAGDVSIPLIGDIGVYVVKIDNITPAPEEFDVYTMKNQIEQAQRAQVNYAVFEALKDKVGVEDNRHKFY
tara:strand:- start:30835 stop:32907 length:2073 start_codon:yes stop_codon:yes gene_type:complete